MVAAAWLGLQAAAHAAPVGRLALEDVLGEAVSLPCAGQQLKATVLFFMSKRSKDESAAFARAVDEKLLNGPVQSVGIVDLRRYGGIWRGLAMSRLRKSASDGRDHRRERRVARGIDASPEVVNRWHLIGDFDGSIFERFGVEREPARPIAFVLDRAGELRGPYSELTGLFDAVARALAD